jgi:hypothetical protein
MNSKTAFKNTYRLMNSERPVFIPFVYGLAAKLEQIPLAEITSDASYYTHALEDACNLFKYDGIVNNFDATIEAELFGCDIEWPDDYAAPRITSCRQAELREIDPVESSRIQILLETTKRTVMSKGKDIAVIGVLTGPCSLVKTITGDKGGDTENAIVLVGSLLTKLVKSLCELRVDAVFFREDILDIGYRDELLAHSKPYTDAYTTLFNLTKYYNCFPALIVKNMEMSFITQLHEMIRPNGLIPLGKKIGEDDMAHLQNLADSRKISFGLPLSLGNQTELKDQFAVISQFINKHKPTGFFYVSEGEVPYDIPLETLHDLIAEMQNV